MQQYLSFKDFLEERFKEVKKKFIDSGSDQNEVDESLADSSNESRNVYFPKKYSSGLKKSTSEKRKTFWKSLGKYPFSKEKYELAQTSTPGDNKKSERQSKYTKKFKELYENQQKALKNKSEKSGIPLSILKKVYNRGMAAWVTGHRPGATQQQWAMARVNSFITKGKTYRTADADLAKELKEINEAEHVFGYKEWGIIDINTGTLYNGKEIPEEEIRKSSPDVSYISHSELRKYADLKLEDVIEYLISSNDNELNMRFIGKSSWGSDLNQEKAVYKSLLKNKNNLPLADKYTLEIFVYPKMDKRYSEMENLDIILNKLREYVTREKDFLEEGFKEVKKKFIDSGSDQTEVDDYLNRFRTLSNQNKLKGDEKNIDLWGKKTFNDFKTFITSKEKEITKTQIVTKKIEGNKVEIDRNNKAIAYIPLDKLSSCNLGRKTDWCTTKVNQKYYEEYVGKGVILVYVIGEKSQPLAALAFHTKLAKEKEMFDPEDNKITEEQFSEITEFDPDELIEKIKASSNIMNMVKASQQRILEDTKKQYVEEFKSYIGTDKFATSFYKTIDFVKQTMNSNIDEFPEMKKLILANRDKLSAIQLHALLALNPGWNEIADSLLKTKDPEWIMKAAKLRKVSWNKEIETSLINDVFNAENGILVNALKDTSNTNLFNQVKNIFAGLNQYVQKRHKVEGFMTNSKSEFLEALYKLIRKIQEIQKEKIQQGFMKEKFDIYMFDTIISQIYSFMTYLEFDYDVEFPSDIKEIIENYFKSARRQR